MHILKLSEIFPRVTSLNGRDFGELVRLKIEELLKRGEKVGVDFEGIEIVTHSFADEIFGVLIDDYGWEFIKNYVKPLNVNGAIKEVLKTVVAFRKYKKSLKNYQ